MEASAGPSAAALLETSEQVGAVEEPERLTGRTDCSMSLQQVDVTKVMSLAPCGSRAVGRGPLAGRTETLTVACREVSWLMKLLPGGLRTPACTSPVSHQGGAVIQIVFSND